MSRALVAMLVLSSGCAVTKVTDLASNASGERLTVTGFRARMLGSNPLWIEQNLAWHCTRGADERLSCTRSVTAFPAP